MRLGVSVGVENWRGTRSVAWPKTDAADFLRVRFTGHTVWQMRDSTRMRRRRTSRESRDREVEASPEEMHRAAFSAEARPKFRKHARGLQLHAPKSIRILRIVGSVDFVPMEWNRIGR